MCVHADFYFLRNVHMTFHESRFFQMMLLKSCQSAATIYLMTVYEQQFSEKFTDLLVVRTSPLITNYEHVGYR